MNFKVRLRVNVTVTQKIRFASNEFMFQNHLDNMTL